MARRGKYGNEKRQKELKKKKKREEKLERKLLKKQGDLVESEEGVEEQTDAVDDVEEPVAGTSEGEAVVEDTQEG